MYDKFIQQGWQCPVCKRVMSPNTSYCVFCDGDEKTGNSTGDGFLLDRKVKTTSEGKVIVKNDKIVG